MSVSAVKSSRRWDQIVPFVRQVLTEFLDDDCLSQGAALAYYAVFSLPAVLVIFVMSAGSLLGDTPEVEEAIEKQFQNLLGSEGGQQIRAMIVQGKQTNQGTFATIFALVAVFLSATGAVGQLQLALNRAWNAPPLSGGWKCLIRKRVLSGGMIVGMAFLLLVSLSASATVQTLSKYLGSRFPAIGWLTVLNDGVSFVLFSILFAALYKFLPDIHLEWRDVAVGAIVTSALFIVGKVLIGQYLGRANIGSAFGAAGSLAILLVWVYYSSLLILLGAEFTQVWALRSGNHPTLRQTAC